MGLDDASDAIARRDELEVPEQVDIDCKHSLGLAGVPTPRAPSQSINTDHAE